GGGSYAGNRQALPIPGPSPARRFVLRPERIHLSRSLKKTIKRAHFEVRYDPAFDQVIDGCARQRRPAQRGTWITRDMRQAYVALHRLGFAHSVESWAEGELQGGLYGVALGAGFFGGDIFARAPRSSHGAV